MKTECDRTLLNDTADTDKTEKQNYAILTRGKRNGQYVVLHALVSTIKEMGQAADGNV